MRETIANALCHRDYGSPHDIQIKVFEDGLVVSSPGQLPFDMPMELLMDPRHASRPRNKIIAQAFFDMGLIEHYGRGITRIQEECARNGNPRPVWRDRYGEFVTEYKPRQAEAREEGPAPSTTQTDGKTTQTTTQTEDPTTQTTTQTHHQPGREISPVQRKILSYLSENPTASRKEIAEHLQNITEDGVKYHLARLQTLDLLHRAGPDFGGRWEVVRPVGD